MSIRKPCLADQVKQLRASFRHLSVGEAQEHIARLNGFASWNQAKAYEKRKTPVSEACAPALPSVAKIYPALHHHRHGTDCYLFGEQPSEEEVIDAVNAASSYEPEAGESLEILNGENVKLPQSAALPGVVEINVTDFIEYDEPQTVQEWRWIQTQASFAHTENGTGPGVWEFMVRADKLRALVDEGGGSQVPSLLRKAIESALEKRPTWILFHQG